jgi:hypothetical protein
MSWDAPDSAGSFRSGITHRVIFLPAGDGAVLYGID